MRILSTPSQQPAGEPQSAVKAAISQHDLQARWKQYQLPQTATPAVATAGTSPFGWRKNVNLIDE